VSGRAWTALLLEPPGRQGYAGEPALADEVDRARAIHCLRVLWPRQPVIVVPWASDAARAPDDVDDRDTDVVVRAAPFFTDAKRLAFVGAQHCAQVTVIRAGALLLPMAVLREVVTQARARSLDVAALAGVPGDVCYVVRGETLALLASLPAVPGTTTLPQMVERLVETTPRGIPLTFARVAPREGPWTPLAAALPASFWRSSAIAPLLALPAAQRLASAVRQQQRAWADAHAEVQARLSAPASGDVTGERRVPVLVVVPSRYQTGAHSAWAQLVPHLPSAEVAFLAGRSTGLHGLLEAHGFGVHEAPEGLGGPSAIDTAALLRAVDARRPAVVHLDGAECNAWAGLLAARGVAVVQHLRLNDIERFRPAFPYVAAIVGVSRHLCDEVIGRTSPSMRVEHIADGVCLEPEVTADDDPGTHGEVRCLCVGRIEPAKDQMRVLDIVEALRARVACRLVLVGPCGSDAAYGDALLERIRDDAAAFVEWRPTVLPMAPLYRQADVVIVASRNEALGMVGIEALAAGRLLVAQRSTGYESIVSPDQRDGLLFDRRESASDVATRIEAALGDGSAYAQAARRTATERFDAAITANRLRRLWATLGAPGTREG
jgi:glycosyltransferase involved in cell wall biosynthesis